MRKTVSARLQIAAGFFFILVLTAGAGKLAVQKTCMDVEAINDAIARAGAGWTAGHTSMTCLSEEERAKYFPPGDPVVEHFAPDTGPGATGELPDMDRGPAPWASAHEERFSWRDFEGEDWMTPVKDQAQCSSCYAFGAVSAIEGAFNVRTRDPGLDLDLAEQFILSCGPGNCEDGGQTSELLAFVQDNGLVDEACFPYVAEDIDCDDNRCPEWEERAVHILSWRKVVDTFRHGIDTAMKERIVWSPIIGGMVVYDDFFAYVDGVYEHVEGGAVGRHSVAIVGWDDAHDSWICKSSWNTDWGLGGYFEIKRGDSGINHRPYSVYVDSSSVGGYPCLEPDQLEIEVPAFGSPVSFPITLGNCGNSTLAWVAEPEPASGWLSVSPGSGSLEADAAQELTVVIDASWMRRPGEWLGSIGVRGGASAAKTELLITVVELPPEADFSADPLEGPAPLQVQFTQLSAGSVESSSWDFGDGAADTARNPVHTYSFPGTYTVSLTASFRVESSTYTRHNYITVLEGEPVDDAADDCCPDDASPEPADAAGDDGVDEGGDDGGCGCRTVR